MIKKNKKAIALALAGILLLGGLYFWLRDPNPHIKPGAISGEGLKPGTTYTADDFTFEVKDAEGKPQLIVRNLADPDHIVMASVPGKSLAGTGSARMAIHESRGSFKVEEEFLDTCTDQIVDSINEKKNPSMILIRGSFLCPDESRIAYQMRFIPATENRMLIEVQAFEKSNRSFLFLASSEEEGYFGFGEQFTYFNMKGRRLPILVQEQGIGRGAEPITTGANITAGAGGDWHTSYAGVPHYITSKMRSLMLMNYEYSVFDMREDNYTVIEVASPRLVGEVHYGKNPGELVSATTEYTGRMKALPDWFHRGAIIGMQGGTEKVRQKLAELQKNNAPISAFWLQDWVGQRKTNFGKQLWWNWELDKDRYPGWDEMVQDLEKQDIRVLTYINPFIAEIDGLKENLRRNLFKEAKDNGYLIKNSEGEPYLILNTDFHAGLVDLTNPEAVAWIKQVIKDELIAVGSAGWMADFGEALPFDAVLYSGESPETYHNRYPEVWARINREAIQEAGREDIVFFSRSGFTRSPEFTTLFWLGDQLVSWDEHDGIKTAVTGLLTSGLSGYSLNHSDIGGYTTINNPIKDYHRSKELFLRWTELSAFNAVFRTHEGNRPEENHQFDSDEETLKHFAKFARIYAALFDYRKQLFQEAETLGWPIVRPLFFHYPEDPNTYNIDYQEFLLGADILMAPVVNEGDTTKEVYFPEGKWIHIFTGEAFEAGKEGLRKTVDAPIGIPAVFVKAENPELLTTLQEAAK
ncbi:MAG: alpha-glucosidase [Leptospiraceae bacterium]|nr:alpha-glucosidase [Leptospiraceae bacterium]